MRINNPYTAQAEFKEILDRARRSFELENSQSEIEFFSNEQLELEKQTFQEQIEPFLLSYHNKPADIYSGRRKSSFLSACEIIATTRPVVLNSACQIGGRSLQKQVALLGDRQLVQLLLYYGFDPDVSYGDGDSLRQNLESLCSFFDNSTSNRSGLKGFFFRSCLSALPSPPCPQDS